MNWQEEDEEQVIELLERRTQIGDAQRGLRAYVVGLRVVVVGKLPDESVDRLCRRGKVRQAVSEKLSSFWDQNDDHLSMFFWIFDR
jgi:hypothetical protein